MEQPNTSNVRIRAFQSHIERWVNCAVEVQVGKTRVRLPVDLLEFAANKDIAVLVSNEAPDPKPGPGNDRTMENPIEGSVDVQAGNLLGSC